MATVELKEIATDITWGDATRDINENNRKIQVALATVSAAGEGNAAWGKSTAESAELIIGGSGTKVVSLEGHTHETSEVNGLDAKLSQTDASIDSLKSSDTAIKGQISGVKTSIGDLYNKVQDIDEGGVKKTELKTLTVNVNGTKVGEYDTKADKTINITADMLGLSGAMTFVGVTVTAISQGSTQNEIDLDDSTTYIAKKGDVVIYGNKEFVWVGSKWQELGDEQSFALKSVTVTGTGYLTGGGNLEANRTIDIASSVKTKIDNGDAALTKANAIETNLANNYPTKNGTGASGTWGVDISGKAASADKVANALTFNSSGAGAAIGSTYDGSGAKTISYNTVGAAKAVHSHAFSDITGKPTTLAGYGITDGASNAELSAHASNTDIHLAEGDRANIEAALVMASDVSSELAVILEGYDTTPTLSTELGKKANVSDLTAHTGNTNVHITASERSSWNAKYSKPATGIPIDDMEAGVAESLANADLALADVGALSQNFINHEGDTTVHITASERKAWNGKVDESSLTAHTGDTTIHITASERSSWNSKYSKPATGIPVDDMEAGVAESLANADLALADVGALSQNFINHEGDTTVHITASERKAWNGKVDASTLNSHTGNTEIHTTSAEKASWNNKAEKASLNAHISDTVVHIQEGEREAWNAKYSKPSTGIPKTDLAEDVQTEINKVNTAITTAGEAKQAVTTHTKDSVIHITADERTAWNGKADESSLTAHTGDTTIHITASERSSWNSKYSKPATGIPVDDMEAGVAESLANADLALADVGALSQNFINHEGDTTVHITANERKAWNAKANASTLNSHTGNTTIHTTAEEKASWNGKYTKPTTGIPAEDLSDDVNASINSGSMSYELASEANGKVSLLLESYGAEIPDLKNELAKKQDKLVSGTSIKTVNGTSLLGSGNITTPKTTVVDNLTSTSGTDALSANQGKVLNDKFGGYIPITGGVAGNVELFSNNRGETLIGNPDNNAYVRIREDMVGVGDNWFINTNGVAGFKNLTANGASVITVTDVVDSLTSTGNDKPLSANQGRVLNEKKYEKPSNGIPMSDLNSAVQQSIECGDEAYASIRSGTIRAREALIQWGGSNNNEGNLSPIESLLTDSANRLTFGNAGGVTVEYSTNGGSTWNAYTERTDYEKLLYPVADAVFCLGGSSSTDRATTLNDMLRITINAKGVGRYLGGIRKMLIYGGTRNARSLNVVLEARRATAGVEGGGNNAFEQVGTLTYDGWPAWGAISLNDSFFGTWSTATTYNNGSVIEYRLTFSVNSVSYTTYGAPYIQLIKLHSLTVYEANEFIAKYGNPLLLMNDGYIHADRELYLTKRVQAQNMQVSNLNVLSSLNITPSTTIQGVLTVGSKISAGGNIEGSAKLTVEGDATLKSNATVSGDLSVGGTLNYTRTRLETSEASVMLDASKYTVINCGGELTINLPNGYATDGKEYLCEMRTGSIGPTVSFPADIKFAFGENFVLGFQPDSVYQISIQNSLAVVIPFV